MAYHFESLPQLVNLRGKLPHDGWQPTNSKYSKTDIAVHHSLTDQGDAYSFSRYHVYTNGWPEIAYHFVILKDGTIQWCHGLQVISYHVGNSNSFAVGVCLVGDFRDTEPTKEQKRSLRELHAQLKRDMPNYKRTRGHDEFPGYAWKPCPEFDYEAVLNGKAPEYGTATGGKATRTLGRGDKGLDVRRLQKKLIEAGYEMDGHGADSSYGPATEKAVKAFQRDQKLDVDGLVGPKTRAKLSALLLNKAEADKPEKTEKSKEDETVAFNDVYKNKWYADELKEAKEEGIAKGQPNGDFNPEEAVTRAEAAVFALRAYKKAKD
ncbi:peptidoglycan-binding protein [Salimicrobium album]|uniref:Autolysin n=1 Tax=Salimicrobium album TaxID=50717 RepID=A0A1H3D9V2_9BACI|nr:peptidoglycan-binding protein [Salimicrobium album]SDX63171.1 N-acetyl-anhydromuramyl-L-alanine amidase AmpD [Salimicrobium album]